MKIYLSMKTLTDFRKTVETGVDLRLNLSYTIPKATPSINLPPKRDILLKIQPTETEPPTGPSPAEQVTRDNR